MRSTHSTSSNSDDFCHGLRAIGDDVARAAWYTSEMMEPAEGHPEEESMHISIEYCQE